jgi:hypothetical protein
MSGMSWMRGVIAVVIIGTACMKTQNVTVPVASEPSATCAARCQKLPEMQAFKCMRSCPGAAISDGECAVPRPACVEQEVVGGRTIASVAGIVVGLPVLAFVVWYVVLDAGPTD